MSGHILIHLGKHSWRSGRVMGTFPPSWSPFSKGLCDVMVMTCPHGETFDKCRLDHWWWLPIRDHIECAQFLLPQSELYYKDMISFTLRISQKSNRKADISILILYRSDFSWMKRNQEISRRANFCHTLHLTSPGIFSSLFLLLESSYSKPAPGYNLLPPWCSHGNFCVVIGTMFKLLCFESIIDMFLFQKCICLY